MTRRVAAIAAAGALLVACGDGGGDGRFGEHADAVRSAVEAGDRTAALGALDQIALEGLEAHDAGELDGAEVAELAALVEQGRALVDQQLPEPTSTTEATTTTTTTAPPPPIVAAEVEDDDDGDGDDEEGKGRGKGKKDDD